MTPKSLAAASAAALGMSCLVFVPMAGAYDVPGPPGSPGGPPTAAKGGSSASKDATKTTAQSIAGYTPLELALRTPKVNFAFPAAGTVTCVLKPGTDVIGSGGATKDKKGDKKFLLNLTNSGRMYLYDNNGSPVAITVSCTFNPVTGKTVSSHAMVVLDG